MNALQQVIDNLISDDSFGSLMDKIEAKKKELKDLEYEYSQFKIKMLLELGKTGIDSLTKDGFIFTKVKQTKARLNYLKAEDEIIQAGMSLKQFYILDDDKFMACFPKSEAIEKVEGATYLKVTRKKEK
jgi:hypothetical protein